MAKQRFSSPITEERYRTNLEEFRAHLEFHNKTPNTIRSYLFALRQFYELYPVLNPENLLLYKCYLIDHHKPQTVNLRIRAMNCYVDFLKLPYSRLLMIRHKNRSFLENVISLADYEYLKNCLLRDGKLNYYFAIRLMAGTGLRISELVQLKTEHVWLGYMDLYSKGNRQQPQLLMQRRNHRIRKIQQNKRNRGSTPDPKIQQAFNIRRTLAAFRGNCLNSALTPDTGKHGGRKDQQRSQCAKMHCQPDNRVILTANHS